jgi:hypothetical protein
MRIRCRFDKGDMIDMADFHKELRDKITALGKAVGPDGLTRAYTNLLTFYDQHLETVTKEQPAAVQTVTPEAAAPRREARSVRRVEDPVAHLKGSLKLARGSPLVGTTTTPLREFAFHLRGMGEVLARNPDLLPLEYIRPIANLIYAAHFSADGTPRVGEQTTDPPSADDETAERPTIQQ